MFSPRPHNQAVDLRELGVGQRQMWQGVPFLAAPQGADSGAGGDGGTTLFRSVSSDEDGGNLANIAASGSEQIKHSAMREQPLEIEC